MPQSTWIYDKKPPEALIAEIVDCGALPANSIKLK